MDISYEKSSSHVPNNVMDWDNTLNNIQDEQETITGFTVGIAEIKIAATI